MKSNRSGNKLPFIKLKCDDPKQAEALISDRFVGQKTGIIYRWRNIVINPRSNSVLSAKVSGTRDKTVPRTKSVLSVEKNILTKIAPKRKAGNLNVRTVGDLMLPLTRAVLFTRNRPSDSMLSNKFLTLQF